MSFLIVSIICTSMMLPGFLSYGVSTLMERKREPLSVFVFTGVMLATGIARTFGVLFALLRPDLETAYRWTMIYEASLLLFFPAIPFFLSSILNPDERGIRIHRRMTVFGGILAVLFIGIIIMVPEAYHRPYSLENLPDPVVMGRGDYGWAGYGSMGLLFAFTVYAVAAAVVAWIRRGNQRYLTTLSVGMAISIFLLIGEFNEVFTGRYLDPLPRFALPRTLVALTVFSLTAIISMTQKAAAEAQEVVRDRNEVKRNRDELARVAYHDEMTGLLNRQAMFRDAASHPRPPRWLILIDIDNLAFINGYHGYVAGDHLIREVGTICVDEAPVDATVYRVNADTFAVMMDGKPSEIGTLCDRILGRVKGLNILNADDERFTASIGLAPAEEGLKWDDWINRANTSLERAKEGRDRYIIFNPALHNDEKRRQDIISGMRRSLDESGFRLEYQPIVTVNREIIGAEALVRWTHPDLGPIGPDEFIPLAEATGLVTRLTQFVVRKSLEDLCGLENFCRNKRVHINLSSRDLSDRNLLDNLDATVRSSGAAESLLGFEITETDLIADRIMSHRNLSALKDRGYSIALDDFGTGYSSLSYLSELPLDRLKIDRSFIADLPGDDRRAALLDAIIRLGDDLHLELIVEGVENEKQLNFLLERNCRLFQGYHFSKPLAIEDFRVWLSRMEGEGTSPSAPKGT